jgi:hypothetical protein
MATLEPGLSKGGTVDWDIYEGKELFLYDMRI